MSKDKVLFVQLKGRQKFLRLFGDSSKLQGLRSGYVVLKPQASIGEHNTGSSEEVIIVTEGRGLISCGSFKVLKVKKHSFVYVPPHTPHNVINTGRVALKYVYTAARA